MNLANNSPAQEISSLFSSISQIYQQILSISKEQNKALKEQNLNLLTQLIIQRQDLSSKLDSLAEKLNSKQSKTVDFTNQEKQKLQAELDHINDLGVKILEKDKENQIMIAKMQEILVKEKDKITQKQKILKQHSNEIKVQKPIPRFFDLKR